MGDSGLPFCFLALLVEISSDSKVNTFAELSQFGRLAEEWCIAYGEDIFDLYTDGGRKTLFVIQTDDALSVERKMGANFPKDEYGLSFIAVYVDRGGRVVSVTSRWNTIAEDDQLLTEDELLRLIGKDKNFFYSAVIATYYVDRQVGSYI